MYRVIYDCECSKEFLIFVKNILFDILSLRNSVEMILKSPFFKYSFFMIIFMNIRIFNLSSEYSLTQLTHS